MAMYHLSAKCISRSQGRSAVSAAAYRSGERLYNDYDGLTHDYSNRTGVVFKEILLPENAPADFFDRQTFWNAIESAEKRKDAQTAREIEIALPLELNHEQQVQLVRGYVNDNFISLGMGADVVIHDGKHRHRKNNDEFATADKSITPDNPHAHILLTTRAVESDGLNPKKNRDWNKKDRLLNWREQWAGVQNRTFIELGLDCRVDHRTLAEQGLQREPTIKEGATVRKMEQRGIKTDRGEQNQQILQRNQNRAGEKMGKIPYEKWLEEQKQQQEDKAEWEKMWGNVGVDKEDLIYAEKRNILGNVVATYHRYPDHDIKMERYREQRELLEIEKLKLDIAIKQDKLEQEKAKREPLKVERDSNSPERIQTTSSERVQVENTPLRPERPPGLRPEPESQLRPERVQPDKIPLRPEKSIELRPERGQLREEQNMNKSYERER